VASALAGAKISSTGTDKASAAVLLPDESPDVPAAAVAAAASPFGAPSKPQRRAAGSPSDAELVDLALDEELLEALMG
jgi:hypothetical protein